MEYFTFELDFWISDRISGVKGLVEVIYTFQFSNAEIARNQRCHSEGRS